MEWKQDVQSRFAVNESAQESSSTDTSKMDTRPRENSLIKLRCREDQTKHCLLLARRIMDRLRIHGLHALCELSAWLRERSGHGRTVVSPTTVRSSLKN